MLSKQKTSYLIGQNAETLAAQHLINQGLILIKKNYRVKFGEIDLIMKEKGILLFIEVRYRSNLKFGSPAETIHFRKQKKIIKTAQHYLSVKHANSLPPCRFDVLTLSQYNTVNICWLKNAFIC